MPDMIFICPKCNIRVYPAEKGVVRKGRNLIHEACDKKESKVNMFQRFFARGTPMVIFPKRKPR